MKKLVIAATIALISTQALAWGDREQGVLIGLASGWVINQVVNQPKQPQQVIVQQQQVPVYIEHPRVVYVQPQQRMTKGWHYDRNCNCYIEVWRIH